MNDLDHLETHAKARLNDGPKACHCDQCMLARAVLTLIAEVRQLRQAIATA